MQKVILCEKTNFCTLTERLEECMHLPPTHPQYGPGFSLVSVFLAVSKGSSHKFSYPMWRIIMLQLLHGWPSKDSFWE